MASKHKFIYRALTRSTTLIDKAVNEPKWLFKVVTGTLASTVIHYLPESTRKNTIRSTTFARFIGHMPVPRAGLIDTGDAVISVGCATVGQVHTLAGLVGDSGEVLVIEPAPSNIGFIEPVLEEYDNVTLDKRGAWSQRDTLTLNLAPEENPADHKIPIEDIEHDNDYRSNSYVDEIEVDVAPLDDILAEYDINPDYVEVMVNGAELEVVKGASRILSRDGPRLWIKGHARNKRTEIPINRKIVQFLEEYHDYDCTVTKGGAPTVGETGDWDRRDGDVFAYREE